MRLTLGFRLALWYTAIFAGSSLAVMAVTYVLLASSLEARDRQIARSMLVELAQRYRSEGLAGLSRAVAAERLAGRREPFVVRVLGRGEGAIFVSVPEGWGEIVFEPTESADAGGFALRLRSGERVRLEGAALRFGDGTLLQVGLSAERREDLLARFRTVLVGVTLLIVLAGIGGGAWLTATSLRPIRELGDAVRTIVTTGKVDARVPVRGTNDTLDELSAAFNSMLDRIGALMEGMRGALDNVAHDLRTPMTRLRNVAEHALANPGSADARAALADCLEESERVLETLEILMDISEAETGTLRLERTRVDLADVVRDAIGLYEDVADDRGLTIETDAAPGLVVDADPQRLRQVVVNLLDNAVKYTPPGGRIRVGTRLEDGSARIEVADTGRGIPAADLPRIWDRLYRGDTSRSERGLGLGLSLVRAVVHAHGGTVDVDSEPGRGSTFTVRLPLAPATPANAGADM